MPQINPRDFKPPPRITDVLPERRPRTSKYPSKRVLDILEDMDTTSRLQISALSLVELAQLKAYMASWLESLEAYGRQTTDVDRAE